MLCPARLKPQMFNKLKDMVGVCTSVVSQENLMTSLFVVLVDLQGFIFTTYL